MTNEIKLYILGGLALLVVIIVLLLINNSKKSSINKEIDELSVRYNAIKSVPLAFKLNKAQAMAKRNDETKEAVDQYYEKYTEAQKRIDEITETIEDVEDELAEKNYKALKGLLPQLKELIETSEKEVQDIDAFLEQFSMKESEQRDVSARLKEVYLNLKTKINENSNSLAISYDGIVKKLEHVEEQFSQSEEWLYSNDYMKAQDTLESISNNIREIRDSYKVLPDLVKDAKGVVPVLLEEVDRQHALSRQRGVYLDHLSIDTVTKEVSKNLNDSIKTLSQGEIDGVKENLEVAKTTLNALLGAIEKENKDFNEAKTINDEILENINKIGSLYKYVSGSYLKDSQRFNMEEIGSYIKTEEATINEFKAEQIKLAGDIESNNAPSSLTKEQLVSLLNKTNKNVEELTSHKRSIDKNSNDEQRAKSQLIKLQVVLNEIEVKVQEYHLPTIASSYKDDLIAGRERVKKIKELLEEIPLNIELLNSTLQDAIDYIYTFYNNVNNVVGMAIMVENAIVFGNKYRSTYAEVDRDLSKAEFSYLNGEYTKALTMAISCMETLFPNKANEKILENK